MRRASPGWPAQRAAAEKMEVQVIDALSSGRTGVRDKSEARLGDAFCPCHARGHVEQPAQQLGVIGTQLGRRADVLSRYQQEMRWRLGRHVAETYDEIVLGNDVRRNVAAGDAAEQAVGG